MERNFFKDVSTVFRNKDIVTIDYVVDGSRIVGRDDILEDLEEALAPAVNGHKPSNCLIYGKPGSGKSLCTRFMCRTLKNRGEPNGVDIGIAYVDCSTNPKETDAVIQMGRGFNHVENPDNPEIYIPDKGLSTAQLYDRAWDALDKHHDIGIVILDEIDKHENYNELLMKLSRAGESGKLDNSKLSVMAISNKTRFKERLSERTKSSLSERTLIFSPYNSEQLSDILEERKDAYKDGVVEDGVINRIAAVCGRDHGDARKAMDIFRYVGEVADQHQSDVVREEYVDEARDRAETDRVMELIANLTHHGRLLVQSVASLAVDRDTSKKSVTTEETIELYKQKCELDSISPLSSRRLRDHLDQAEFLEILTKQTNPEGGGGSKTKITLIDDPQKVLQATKRLENE